MKMIGGPTLITLHYKDAPLATVYEDLISQAGLERHMAVYSFPADGTDPTRISIDIDDLPFWEAVRQLEKLTQLHLAYKSYSFMPQRYFYLSRVEKSADRAVTQGFFPVYLQQTKQTETQIAVNNGTSPETQEREKLTLSFEACADPKFFWYRPLQPRLTRAVDEQGRSLLKAMDLSKAANYDDSVVSELKRPAGSNQRIAVLSGFIRYLVIAKNEEWTIENPFEAVGGEYRLPTSDGEEIYRLEKIQKTDSGAEFHLTMTREPLPDAETDFMPAGDLVKTTRIFRREFMDEILVNSMWVEDTAKQKRADDSGRYNGTDPIRKSTLTYRPHPQFPDASPVRFVWQLPREMYLVEVPFEIKNLPLQ